jgi:hypothetical protein
MYAYHIAFTHLALTIWDRSCLHKGVGDVRPSGDVNVGLAEIADSKVQVVDSGGSTKMLSDTFLRVYAYAHVNPCLCEYIGCYLMTMHIS